MSEEKVLRAKQQDEQQKMVNEAKVNSSKYRKISSFQIGDVVYVRNYNKNKKFDPLFLEFPFEIIDMSLGNKIQVKQIYPELWTIILQSFRVFKEYS